MEVKVYLRSPEDGAILKSLKLMDEPGLEKGHAIAWVYLTPAELEKLKTSGLEYVINNYDLNYTSRHFWDRSVLESYHNYNQMVELSDSLAANFPAICKKILLGTTLGGRQLGILKISDNVNTDENEPEVMFDGGIHGDEIMGPEIVIRYARDLCLGYGVDSTYTNLINSREIWLYYLVNPDGFASGIRYNSNGVDCNRDIGFMWGGEGYSTGPFSQPESRILRQLWLDHNFILYTNFHGGTEVISYPWSYRISQPPDWQHINQLAAVYSSTSGYANLGYGQGCVIMYQIFGATKDFNYGALGQVGWSMEISQSKQPPSSQIPMYYNYNVPAITEMINRVGWGLEGKITDQLTGSPVKAAVFVNSFYPVYTQAQLGDYHKYLLPGQYTIVVKASGYQTKTISGVTVPAQGSVIKNIQLTRTPGRYAYRCLATNIPSFPSSGIYFDESYVPGMVGPPDSVNYSLGRSGYIIIDMGDTIYNGTGNDFRIYEGDTSPEGYTCYVSQNMDGPWTNLGTGSSTTAFDLSTSPISGIRYVKILDDGDGATNANDAGFDLDGIEILTPPLIADFMAGNTNPCMGDPVNFFDMSIGNPTSWLWQFPGGTPSASLQQNPAGITYSVPGQYNVSLSVQNSFTHVTTTKEFYIHVGEAPSTPSSPAGPLNVCQNGVDEYTTVGSPSASSFIWDLAPAESGTVSGQWMTATVEWDGDFTGSAFLKVKEVTSCGESQYSDSTAITVNQVPVTLLGPDTTICTWEWLTLDAGNPGSTYEWSTGETTQSILVNSSGFGIGMHTIWVQVTTSGGCMASDTMEVTIDACSGVAASDDSQTVEIYPNPNQGTFYFNTNNIEQGICEILTIQGKVVYTLPQEKNMKLRKITLPDLPKGIYFLRIRSDRRHIIEKLIIQ